MMMASLCCCTERMKSSRDADRSPTRIVRRGTRLVQTRSRKLLDPSGEAESTGRITVISSRRSGNSELAPALDDKSVSLR
jgi:hypothetical protein